MQCLKWTCYDIHQKHFIKLKDRGQDPTWANLPREKYTNSPKSTITMLPLIDLNPRNERCICSTLLYVTEQAKHLNIELSSTNICELKRLNSQN